LQPAERLARVRRARRLPYLRDRSRTGNYSPTQSGTPTPPQRQGSSTAPSGDPGRVQVLNTTAIFAKHCAIDTRCATGGGELIIRKARMLPSHPARYWPPARERIVSQSTNITTTLAVGAPGWKPGWKGLLIRRGNASAQADDFCCGGRLWVARAAVDVELRWAAADDKCVN
jgi:hypothetical protein